MTPYWIVSLCLKHSRVVTGPGRYVTRGGDTVTVTRVDHYRAYGSYDNGPSEWWTVVGRVLPHTLSQNDIVRPL